MFPLGNVCFHWESCVSTGKRALSLGIMCFHWETCAFTGNHVFSLGIMCFHWETCVFTGKRVFSLGIMCFHWETCVFTGHHVLWRDSLLTVLNFNAGLTIMPNAGTGRNLPAVLMRPSSLDVDASSLPNRLAGLRAWVLL